MALVNCPECGKEVADSAEACPNCGYGISKHFRKIETDKRTEIKKEKLDRNKNKILRKILILIIFLLIIIAVTFFVYTAYKKNREYIEFRDNLNSNKIKDAVSIYDDMTGYKDMEELLYDAFEKNVSDNSINNILLLYSHLKNSSNANKLVYEVAKENYSESNFSDSLLLFNEIIDYEDSKKYITDATFMSKIQGKWHLVYEGIGPRYFEIDGWRVSYILNSPNTTDGKNFSGTISKVELIDDNICAAYEFKNRRAVLEEYIFYDDDKNTIIADSDDYTWERVENVITHSTSPFIGMTEGEAELSSWGKPENIYTTTLSDGTENEQWVYNSFKYLYFSNGILVSIQESK